MKNEVAILNKNERKEDSGGKRKGKNERRKAEKRNKVKQ